uniref:Ig-like domain-containing protein n=1 Tax=Astyanax mexicanus TaxID=7994 RepID=A0A8B9LPL4_ASTMX
MSPKLRSLFLCEAADPISPDQSFISISEGSSITLSCTYEGSPYRLHWYQKKTGSRPEFLMLIHVSSKQITKSQKPDPRLSINLQESNKVNLEISSTAVSDSALYYCALQPTNHIFSVEGAASLLYFLC